jgi:predicted RND superfamily exporter protein
MITRLYAMYQRSRKMLIFLVALFLALTIAGGVMSGITSRHTSGGKFQL